MRRDQNEVRMVSKTGGAKGQKLERFDLIPWDYLRELSVVYGKGAKKYEENNWRRGYRWSLSIASLFRHITWWILGEKCDKESGLHHLAHAGFHLATLFTFDNDSAYSQFDDRQDAGMLCDPAGGPEKTVTFQYVHGVDVDEEEASSIKEAEELPDSDSDPDPEPEPGSDVFTEGKMAWKSEDLRTIVQLTKHIEQIGNSTVRYRTKNSGWIDNVYLRGTDFESKKKLLRLGVRNPDEAVEKINSQQEVKA